MDGTPRCGGILPQRAVVGPLSPMWERDRERGRLHFSPSPVSSPIEGEEQNGTCQNLGVPLIESRLFRLLSFLFFGFPAEDHFVDEAVLQRLLTREKTVTIGILLDT